MEQQRIKELEKRIEALEQENAKRVQAEQLQLKTTQLLRLDVQETRVWLERIKFDTGDVRERLDTLEHGQQELKQDISAIFEVFVNSSKQIEDNLGEFRATMSERFDTNERVGGTVQTDVSSLKATQAEQGQKLDLILQLLQPKPPTEQ